MRAVPILLFAGTLLALTASGTARAQDESRNYNKPLLVVETGGHSAPVRVLIWPKADVLFSGGLDKTVRVWELGAEPRLAQTIRPPVWRGLSGQILALALSRPDAGGQSYLAAVGSGVSDRGADFTVFRFPGTSRTRTGDAFARRLPDRPGAPGHLDNILCAAFSPDGRFLVTGGNDGRVILWTVPGFEPTVLPEDPVALPPGWRRDVRALAFQPDGVRFVTGGGDGTLRLWDLATRALVNRRRIVANQDPNVPRPINTLAFGPNGTQFFVGLESGGLFRFDASVLSTGPAEPLPRDPRFTGPVEALVVGPDGQTLTLSIKTDRSETIDLQTLSCVVEVRRLADSAVLHRRRVSGLVKAIAYRPDGRMVAYGGGPSHAIERIDLANLNAPVAPRPLRGQGSSLYSLAFTADSRSIGFTTAATAPGQPAAPDLDGFDLAQRVPRRVPRAGLVGSLSTHAGWTLEIRLSTYEVAAVHADGRRRRLPLDAATDRNPWSSTFVPPGPGHPRPLVAVGCEPEIVLFDFLADDPAPALDARRVRWLAGHQAPVTALAVSPDGRWLASGSFDQTVRLFALDGRDRVPSFGATFAARTDGLIRVAAVEPGGAAAEMGLRPGDLVLRAALFAAGARQEATTPSQFLAFPVAADALAPGRQSMGLQVLRPTWLAPGLPVFLSSAFQSTKRDNPALSLMLGRDRQWVVWTPRGYYDASVEGDALRLHWQINPPFDRAEPTDFLPVVAHSATMYKPRVLDRLWETGKLDLSVLTERTRAAEPDDVALAQRAPEIHFEAVPGGPSPPPVGSTWTVTTPDARLRLTITGRERSRVLDRQIHFNESLLTRPALAAPLPRVDDDLVLAGLPPGRTVRLSVRALSEDRIPRLDWLDVRYEPPAPLPIQPPPARPPRTVVLGVGIARAPGVELPELPYAVADVNDLGTFLPRVLLASSGERPAPAGASDRKLLLGDRATQNGLLEALQWLRGELEAKRLEPGDLVITVVSAHVLALDEAAAEGDSPEVIVAADTRLSQGTAPAPVVSATELAERLGEVSDYGCRVVLFLDGVHDLRESSRLRVSVKRLTRDLWLGRGVVTFVASENGPSLDDATLGQGYFALGVHNAFRLAPTRPVPTAPYTLAEFADAARDEIAALSSRLQDMGCHIPLKLPPDTRFATPP